MLLVLLPLVLLRWLLLFAQELSHVANSLIGEETLGIKGISGGEKRSGNRRRCTVSIASSVNTHTDSLMTCSAAVGPMCLLKPVSLMVVAPDGFVSPATPKLMHLAD